MKEIKEDIAKLTSLVGQMAVNQTCPNNSIGRPNSAQSRPITQSLEWVIGIGIEIFWDFGIGRIGLLSKMCPSNLPQIGGDAYVEAVSGASTYALLTSLL